MMTRILCKDFKDLSVYELYDIMQLRESVFQIEQTCIYKDLDDKDKVCQHLMTYQQDQLLAYCRIVPKGVSYSNYASIGRVCTALSARKMGFGKELMIGAIQYCRDTHKNAEIKISAQSYLLKFYSELGFEPIGEEYLEDDIPHTAMIYKG